MPDTDISKTDAAILGMLTIEPMTGYDMKHFPEQSLAHFWHESYGNLYPRLARLSKAGLIRGRRQQRTRGPDAIVYSLTARGRRALASWLTQPADREQVRSEFMLKVFFGGQASIETVERHVEDEERRQQEAAASYEALRHMLGDDLAGRPEFPYWLMSLRRGELLTEARLRWCRECRDMLRDLRKTRREEGS